MENEEALCREKYFKALQKLNEALHRHFKEAGAEQELAKLIKDHLRKALGDYYEPEIKSSEAKEKEIKPAETEAEEIQAITEAKEKEIQSTETKEKKEVKSVY